MWNFEGMAENGLPIVWDESYGARLGVMPEMGYADVTGTRSTLMCSILECLRIWIRFDFGRMPYGCTMKPGSSSELADPMDHKDG